jgi:hypothetical protein
MRWYFGIDEGGSQGVIGDMAKLAVLSAKAVGGLEPVLLYHGGQTPFCDWMRKQGVQIIETRPSFWDQAEAAIKAGTFVPHTIGHWLRVMIPQIETRDEYVLYTDCDVIFLRRFDWASLRPPVITAGPEMTETSWSYFNSGVMMLNIPALRATYPAFEAEIVTQITSGAKPNYDDQYALNKFYEGHWQRLTPLCNYKPYWPRRDDAAVLHWHGPKPDLLGALAANRVAAGEDPTLQFFTRMLTARIEHYLSWSRYLGDMMQGIDLTWAIRFARLASDLTIYRHGLKEVGDSGFMNHQNFS